MHPVQTRCSLSVRMMVLPRRRRTRRTRTGRLSVWSSVIPFLGRGLGAGLVSVIGISVHAEQGVVVGWWRAVVGGWWWGVVVGWCLGDTRPPGGGYRGGVAGQVCVALPRCDGAAAHGAQRRLPVCA